MNKILKILDKNNYFTNAKQEVSKEQEVGTELLSAELKSFAFTPTFTFCFSRTVLFAAPF